MTVHQLQFNSIRRLPRWIINSCLGRGLAGIGLILLLGAGYTMTGQPVTLIVNGQSYSLRVHRLTVEIVLREWSLELAPQDIVSPPLKTPLRPGQTIMVQLARPVVIEADGRTFDLLTQQRSIAGVLTEAGIMIDPRDEVLINGQPWPEADLPAPTLTGSTGSQPELDRLLAPAVPQGALARPDSIQLIVRRAVPVGLNDDGLQSTFYTTQPNVGEALLEQGLTLFLGDKVTPDLGTLLSPGMKIYIQRSIPVTIMADGWMVKTRTRRQTVGAVLAQEGIALMGQDFSRPVPAHSVSAGTSIEVVRVRETLEIEEELIPFETSWIAEADMVLDQQEIRQQGQTGVIKTRTRIRYENGQEARREVEDEWLDQEPMDRVIVYGTKIIVNTLETEEGPLEYWRKISMLATPYSAATSGKEPDHPRYGITRSGLPVRYGMAAVDPKVIPLMTELYVPGYGRALAADTGGLILGKHIDLAYEEDQPMPDMYGWRDVYILTPVPPADKIRYVLPQWPQRP